MFCFHISFTGWLKQVCILASSHFWLFYMFLYHLHKELALSLLIIGGVILIARRPCIFYCLSHLSHVPLFFLLSPSNIQGEVKSEEGPEWNILRDDFMMGASMKDWDKESDGEGNSEEGGGLKQEDDSD